MTEREPWLGHWDGCSIQWSDICDCDPANPVNLADQSSRLWSDGTPVDPAEFTAQTEQEATDG
jgi:hypothetical protein